MPSSAASFHVYVVRDVEGGGRSPFRIAQCEEDGLGLCLRTLSEEGQIKTTDAVGVMHRDADEDRGRWLINPFGTLR